MKNENAYTLQERADLVTRYREAGESCCGGTNALKWYKLGISIASRGAKFDQKNYEYYYYFQRHCKPYERKGLRFFEKAAKCFHKSGELGNELAMMNYALYLFSFKGENSEALKWFLAASDAGLAVADYELAIFYQKGYCGVAIDAEKAEWYFQRYQTRCAESERQAVLAWNIDDDGAVIGRSYMYSWFRGYSFPEIYDTPSAKPSSWKYNVRNKKDQYEGRYFLKEVIDEFGQPKTIKVDKVELTDYYQQIIREVEIKVARKFTKDPNATYPTVWDEGWQLPSYAWVCDRCDTYYLIKKHILKKEYGIDYLTFYDLNR